MIRVFFKPCNSNNNACDEDVSHQSEKEIEWVKENRTENKVNVRRSNDEIEHNHKIIYIQMKLPTIKITHEFENLVKAQIGKKYINVKIREATEEDYPTIISIYKRAWMTSNTPISDLSIDTLRKLDKSNKTKIFLANVYGIAAGFVILDLEGEKNEIGFITALGIIPRFQRRRIGTSLGVRSWEYFKQFDVKELRTEVYINNKKSKDFLESLGFEEFDRLYDD